MRLLLAAALLSLAACGGGSSNPAAPEGVPVAQATPAPFNLSEETVFTGAGDVGWPGSTVQKTTGEIVADDVKRGAVAFVPGDAEQSDGMYPNYILNYEPFWGSFLEQTLVVPGNHDYHDYLKPGADDFFRYFGSSADPDGTKTGWFVKRYQHVTVIGLNSSVNMRANSAQIRWLQALLPTITTPCTMAFWHHPRWSSFRNGDNPNTEELWKTLDGVADVIVNGHDHAAERMAPVNWKGKLDTKKGIRQFTAGGGGAVLYEEKKIVGHSQFRLSAHHVLRLRFASSSYRWEYIGLGRQTLDSDAAVSDIEKQCH